MLKYLSTVLAVASAKNEKCHALVLSGGGAHGAYEAGVLYAFLNSKKSKADFTYDVVAGASAGSINALAMSLFAVGDEIAMVEFMTDTWQNLKTKEIFENWKPYGLVTGILEETGLFNDAPLQKTLNGFFQELGSKILRRTVLSCGNVGTGSYTLFDENSPDIVKSAISSSSIPAVFPIVEWPDYQGQDLFCMDGGVEWSVNVPSAIQRCHELVKNDSDIVIDVIDCTYSKALEHKKTNNALENYLFYDSIKKQSIGHNAVAEWVDMYPEVNFRYLVYPSEGLPGGVIGKLDFSNSTFTWPTQLAGRNDGQAAIEKGEGFRFNQIKEAYELKFYD